MKRAPRRSGAKAGGARREVRGAKHEVRRAKPMGAEAGGAKPRGAKQEVRGAKREVRGAKKLAGPAEPREIEAIRRHIEDAASARTPRWNADPKDVRRSVLKLVLTLVELIRQLLERQAIRRMEGGTLSDEETESVGLALMKLQETITELAAQFDISPDELNLDLGPVGKLL
jgi:hypothetical protein